MPKETNIVQWLRSWLNGDKQSEGELRNAAREDSFLADAMEGYEQFPELDHKASLERLRGKLAKRTQGSKHRTMVWYLPRIAAAASILLVAIWLINQNQLSKSAEVAMTTPSTTVDSDMDIQEPPVEDVLSTTESAIVEDTPDLAASSVESPPAMTANKPPEQQIAQRKESPAKKNPITATISGANYLRITSGS